jgi:quinol monooxygenase YgiN/GNAT superfamily N-acetyltransferase
MEIEYRDDAKIDAEQAIELYRRSTLGERRPVDRPDLFERMLRHANLKITAWHGSRLIGISRTLTDFAYVAYLSDLAVDVEFQRQGVGRRLIEETRSRLEPDCMIVLLAAPKADDYYPQLNFERNPRAWILRGCRPLAATEGSEALGHHRRIPVTTREDDEGVEIMTRIAVIARIKARSEYADEIRKQLSSLVEPTRTKDEGCIRYELYHDDEDPALFYFLEEWESRDSLQRHLASEHVQEHLKSAGGMLEDRTVTILRRVG